MMTDVAIIGIVVAAVGLVGLMLMPARYRVTYRHDDEGGE